MSILIKGMTMPKNCFLCPFCVPEADEDNGEMCAVSGQFPLMNKEERNVECPLIEVPPHGRLIDAEMLTTVTEMVNGEFKTYIEVFEVLDAPTIIEAEEKET